jgi:excisionase family DNA binding protein
MVTREYGSDLMSISSTGLSDHEKTSAPSRDDKYAYSVDEACRLLSIGRTSLYALAKSGDLKLLKIAGRTLVPRSEMERLTSVGDADDGGRSS